jgi:hypothetical protein
LHHGSAGLPALPFFICMKPFFRSTAMQVFRRLQHKKFLRTEQHHAVRFFSDRKKMAGHMAG